MNAKTTSFKTEWLLDALECFVTYARRVQANTGTITSTANTILVSGWIERHLISQGGEITSIPLRELSGLLTYVSEIHEINRIRNLGIDDQMARRYVHEIKNPLLEIDSFLFRRLTIWED